MTTQPLKCAICGREGPPTSFKTCPECNRIIGSECWQPKYQMGDHENREYPDCKHRLSRPKITKGIALDS
jgi:hypothetical protein